MKGSKISGLLNFLRREAREGDNHNVNNTVEKPLSGTSDLVIKCKKII